MSSDDSDRPENTPDEAPAEAEEGTDLATETQEEALSAEGAAEKIAEEELVAGQIGVQRYVHAAFFAAGILSAYLSGKLILSAWNSLADWASERPTWSSATKRTASLIMWESCSRARMSLITTTHDMSKAVSSAYWPPEIHWNPETRSF